MHRRAHGHHGQRGRARRADHRPKWPRLPWPRRARPATPRRPSARRSAWVGTALRPNCKRSCSAMTAISFFCDNMRQGHPDCTLDAMVTGDPYKVRMVWVQSTNMISGTCGAEPEKWYQGLMNAEFNMATDLFVTPTIEAACDLFLPLSTCPEKDDVNMAHYGGSPIMHGSTNRAIDPGETKGDQQILIDLGRWNAEAARDGRLRGPARPSEQDACGPRRRDVRRAARRGVPPARRELPQVRDGASAS